MASENRRIGESRSEREEQRFFTKTSLRQTTNLVPSRKSSLRRCHDASGIRPHVTSRHKTAVNARFSASVPLYLMRPSLSLSILALFANFAYGFSSPPPTKPLRFLGQARKLVGHPAPLSTGNVMSTSNISRGGALKAVTTSKEESSMTPYRFLASFWGTTGVVYILAKAIRRVLPIALEPFLEASTPLSQFQLG